jgi:hypothetical protein
MLTGYLENINSDRKIIDTAQMRLDMLYFPGYDIDEPLPWYSTLSRARKLFSEEVFLELFRNILKMCVSKGMVCGKTHAVDNAFIKENDKKQAEKELARFDEQWSKKYPYIMKSWLENLDRLSQMFELPDMIRKMIYTTNIIESFNSQLRKATKFKRAFTNYMALMKLLYLVQIKALEKIKPVTGWKQIMAQFIIIFENRWYIC